VVVPDAVVVVGCGTRSAKSMSSGVSVSWVVLLWVWACQV
jgi:hypothetical protein